MTTRDELFERWLRRTVRHTVLDERRLYEQDDDEDDDDEGGIFGDEDDDESDADADVKAAVDDAEEDQADHRGGQQKARAATREVPPPKADDLTIEVIVDKLNAIRSGKSLKDVGVRQRIGEYFNDLTSAQRLALFAFLEGLAEVVASEVPGDDARSPGDPDIGVKMGVEERADEEEDDEPRVAKHNTEETSGDEKVVVRGGRRGDGRGQADVPKVTRDAGDDSPVMVVHR